MTSVIRDPLIDLSIARWDCVNASGPCDCDNGVNKARVEALYGRQQTAADEYQERRERYPIEPKDIPPGTEVHISLRPTVWFVVGLVVGVGVVYLGSALLGWLR